MNPLLRCYPGDHVMAWAATAAVQIAVVVLTALWVSRIFLRRNPAALYGLWLCALMCVPLGALATWGFEGTGISLVRLPLLSSPIFAGEDENPVVGSALGLVISAFSAPLSTSATDSGVPVSPNVRRAPFLTASRLRSFGGGLCILWMIGALIFLTRFAWGCRLLWVLRRELKPLDERRLGDLPAQVRRTLAASVLPALATSRHVSSPISLGILNPVVILPARLIGTLGGRQLHDVLVHECAHLLRRDHAIGLLQRLAQIVCWPHPLIYLLNRELARAREEVCDNYVLRGGNVHGYARTLLTLAQQSESSRSARSGIGLLQPRHVLENRVAGLLDRRRKLITHMPTSALTLMATGLFAAVLAISGTRIVAARAPKEKLVASGGPAVCRTIDRSPRMTVAAKSKSTQAAPRATRFAEKRFSPEPTPGHDERTALADAARSPAPKPVRPMASADASRQSSRPRDAVAGRFHRQYLGFNYPLATRHDPLPTPTPPVSPNSRAGDLAAVPSTLVTVDERSDSRLLQAAGHAAADSGVLPLDIQPAVFIECDGKGYLVSLRLAEDDVDLKLAVEPGKPGRITIEEEIDERLVFEITVQPGRLAEHVEATYRLSLVPAPEAMYAWQARQSICKLRQWIALSPAAESVLPSPATGAASQDWTGVFQMSPQEHQRRWAELCAKIEAEAEQICKQLEAVFAPARWNLLKGLQLQPHGLKQPTTRPNGVTGSAQRAIEDLTAGMATRAPSGLRVTRNVEPRGRCQGNERFFGSTLTRMRSILGQSDRFAGIF